MNVYLDTSHLQKWSQGTLSSADISILNNLRDSGNSEFILSPAHIFDITDREDRESAIAVAKFLDQLPKKWIINPVDLKREEIKNAINYYKNKTLLKINPFRRDYIDSLISESQIALMVTLIAES